MSVGTPPLPPTPCPPWWEPGGPLARPPWVTVGWEGWSSARPRRPPGQPLRAALTTVCWLLLEAFCLALEEPLEGKREAEALVRVEKGGLPAASHSKRFRPKLQGTGTETGTARGT